MSFSQLNRRLKAEPEYWYAFLTMKNGNSINRESTCSLLNLQLGRFSAPIWLEHIFRCSITSIIELIARFFAFSEKKNSSLK